MNKKCLTTEQFIVNSRLVHGDTYDYSVSKYKNSHTKIKIICKKHGVFETFPYNHTSKKANCPKCALVKIKKSFIEFKRKADQIHKKKYKYIEDSYKNSKSIIEIICPIHGKFKQRADNHLSGHGCRKCFDKNKI